MKLRLLACLVVGVTPLASAGEALITQFDRSIDYADFSGIAVTEIDIFVAVSPAGVLDPFDGPFPVIVESVDPGDAGSVFTADLTAPEFDDQQARLTNGKDDTIWSGGRSENASDFDPRFESGIFAGVIAPDGTVLTGPDLMGFTPTRIELELNDLSLEFDGMTSTAVDGSVTVRFFIDTGGCNPADFARPFGTLDLDDVSEFASLFAAGDDAADLAEPAGLLDLADVLAFVDAFMAGCP